MAQVESDDQGQAIQGSVIQAALGGKSQRCSACGLLWLGSGVTARRIEGRYVRPQAAAGTAYGEECAG